MGYRSSSLLWPQAVADAMVQSEKFIRFSWLPRETLGESFRKSKIPHLMRAMHKYSKLPATTHPCALGKQRKSIVWWRSASSVGVMVCDAGCALLRTPHL